jgi:tetratricopeptide (TPR) repeat protein
MTWSRRCESATFSNNKNIKREEEKMDRERISKSLDIATMFSVLMENVVWKFESNEFDEIISQADDLKEIDEDNPVAYLLRAIAQWKKGNSKEAFDDIKKVFELSESTNEFIYSELPTDIIRRFLQELRSSAASRVKTYRSSVLIYEDKALMLKVEADDLIAKGKQDEALEKYNLSIAYFMALRHLLDALRLVESLVKGKSLKQLG